MQSEMDLVVGAISRTENGHHVAVDIDAPRSGPNDLRLHSPLVRIIDAVAGVPEKSPWISTDTDEASRNGVRPGQIAATQSQ